MPFNTARSMAKWLLVEGNETTKCKSRRFGSILLVKFVGDKGA